MTDCTAGQTKMPTDCRRHANHYWCGVCEGFYGVPHDNIHSPAAKAHPRSLHSAQMCACRPCQQYAAEHTP